MGKPDYKRSVSDSELQEYLQKKGVSEIIVEIITGRSTFSSLEESVGISQTTLSRRLKEGIKLGILKETIYYDMGSDKQKVYELTDQYSDIESRSIFEETKSLLEEKKEIERKLDKQYNNISRIMMREPPVIDIKEDNPESEK